MATPASEIQLSDRISVGGQEFTVTYAITTPLDGTTTLQLQSPDLQRATVTIAVPGSLEFEVATTPPAAGARSPQRSA